MTPAPEIRPATREDIVAFYGRPAGYEMPLIWAAVQGGRPIALWGTYLCNGDEVAFCDLEPEAHAYRRLIVRSARALVRAVAGRSVKAVCHPGPGAARAAKFLAGLGFVATDAPCPYGTVFELKGAP
jgi:hypothetical protein